MTLFSGEPRVYPRVCGGTSDSRLTSSQVSGLSPRVRGNPALGGGGIRRVWSIPACAGEPSVRPGMAPRPGVYPPVCGGTYGGDRLRTGIAR